MADLAYVFHWPPDAMAPMPLAELMQWHQLAIDRHNRANGVKD